MRGKACMDRKSEVGPVRYRIDFRSGVKCISRVNVASLLMIVLMNKMEYATDILKCLLLRLVDKSVISKHPQLMLRRTESVVEKMLTNYMAICMYDYLKEYAGSSLFLLFKAIKHQIEKGLVDAITHDARYSISEERLLHEQISHSVVMLHIVQDDLDEKVQCKVLDWDTISQVKSKILDALFKNTPFSMRPTIHEVDLEWRHGRGGHLILQDEDLTTKTTNGWRRLNTLAHYGVKESAVMSLVARQNDSYNLQYSNKLQPPYNNCTLINIDYSHRLFAPTSSNYTKLPINAPPMRPNAKFKFFESSGDRASRVAGDVTSGFSSASRHVNRTDPWTVVVDDMNSAYVEDTTTVFCFFTTDGYKEAKSVVDWGKGGVSPPSVLSPSFVTCNDQQFVDIFLTLRSGLVAFVI
ncbi:hypothetical protein GQX74_005795 [Glossina fuscipes]|nr:hypothetical protein GQX74_005795 [Glossina fuscipes]